MNQEERQPDQHGSSIPRRTLASAASSLTSSFSFIPAWYTYIKPPPSQIEQNEEDTVEQMEEDTVEQMEDEKITRGRKKGAGNYSSEDFDALLDAVEDVKPLGANEWARVTKNYNEYATENDRGMRDIDGVKAKFDKLLNHKKQTGSTSCHLSVRRAKQIGRSIKAKVNAVVVENASGEKSETMIHGEDRSSGAIKINRSVGVSPRKRSRGAGGVRKEGKYDALTENLGILTDEVIKYVDRNQADPKKLTQEEVEEFVDRRVENRFNELSSSLDELKAMFAAAMKK